QQKGASGLCSCGLGTYLYNVALFVLEYLFIFTAKMFLGMP
ncbi:mCG1027136, partial [Mus musculus]